MDSTNAMCSVRLQPRTLYNVKHPLIRLQVSLTRLPSLPSVANRHRPPLYPRGPFVPTGTKASICGQSRHRHGAEWTPANVQDSRVNEDSILAVQVFDQKKFKKKDQGFLGVINVRIGDVIELAPDADGTLYSLTVLLCIHTSANFRLRHNRSDAYERSKKIK